MALIDLDGVVLGAAVVSGSVAMSSTLAGAATGSSSSVSTMGLTYQFAPLALGQAAIVGTAHGLFGVSGRAEGRGTAVDDGRVIDAAVVAVASSVVQALFSRLSDIRGYARGSSALKLSEPDPIYGTAVVTGFMEVICVPYAVCQTPPVQRCFRWGHQFGPADLEICLTGARCVSYTLFQIQKGCTPRQVGPSGRRPAKRSPDCYYATGTAGECGQPGLWVIRWTYQQSFGACFVEKDCYFYVLDSVLCPVGGDELPRACKYGWD